MNKSQFYWFVLCFVFILTACEKNMEDGGCTYHRFKGIAQITDITDAAATAYNCSNQPKQISFKFTPDLLSDRDVYQYTQYEDSLIYLTINTGMNPSLTWVEANEIMVGKTYICYRAEIEQGTCTPVIFEIEGLDQNSEDDC